MEGGHYDQVTQIKPALAETFLHSDFKETSTQLEMVCKAREWLIY